jgi:hypothetical protein
VGAVERIGHIVLREYGAVDVRVGVKAVSGISASEASEDVYAVHHASVVRGGACRALEVDSFFRTHGLDVSFVSSRYLHSRH